MKKRKISKTKMLYIITRIVISLLLVFNVIGFLIDKDDSQKSRDLFNAVQSLLMLICTFTC